MAASQCPSSLARRIEADAQELHLIGSKSELPRTLVGASSANRRVLGCPVLYRSGAPDTIRTCDLCLRRATLYPAELRVREGSFSRLPRCGQCPGVDVASRQGTAVDDDPMSSNIEPLAREMAERICRRSGMAEADLLRVVDLHWPCAAAMLEAGVMDEGGEWLENKDVRLGMEAYRER